MPYYTTDEHGALIPIKGGIPEEVIQFMESYDDEVIVRSMTMGAAAEAYVYQYEIDTKQGKKIIIGISTEGANYMANAMANIEALNDARFDKDSDPDYIYAMVRVKNLVRNVTLLGVGRACKYMIGKGNEPDKSRIDEHAFVKSVSKAQRNGILHHADEELVLRIITEAMKKGKSARIGPPTVSTEKRVTPPTPAPAKPAQPPPVSTPTTTTITAEDLAKQQQKLTELRTLVYNRFTKELGITEENIKSALKAKFGTEELTALNEVQLNECLVMIDNAIARQKAKTAVPTETPTTTPQATLPTPEEKAVSLGFTNRQEQAKLRQDLYNFLVQTTYLGMTVEQAKAFVAQRGFTSSADAPKDKLLEMIKEASEMAEAKNNPPSSEQSTLEF